MTYQNIFGYIKFENVQYIIIEKYTKIKNIFFLTFLIKVHIYLRLSLKKKKKKLKCKE